MRELPHVLGIVLAGGEGKRLYPLTPTVPSLQFPSAVPTG
ncbi:sugar phosphate nucleotidyltransferase [Microtetraspora sp. AC03309]|nr:sugar phosphate nucleotidyltransferase [Microtetraspora sp. AC03309]